MYSTVIIVNNIILVYLKVVKRVGLKVLITRNKKICNYAR